MKFRTSLLFHYTDTSHTNILFHVFHSRLLSIATCYSLFNDFDIVGLFGFMLALSSLRVEWTRWVKDAMVMDGEWIICFDIYWVVDVRKFILMTCAVNTISKFPFRQGSKTRAWGFVNWLRKSSILIQTWTDFEIVKG